MNRKTKVLFFLPNFNMGGAEKVTINLIRALDRMLFELHIVVLTTDGPLYDLVPKDVVLHILNVSKTSFSIFRLRKLLVELRPDIVYSTLFRTHTALEMACTGFKRRPAIILRNPTSPKLVIAEGNMSFLEIFFSKIAYKKAIYVLAQTPEMKEEMVEYFHIAKDKIHVFINPLDVSSIQNGIKNQENPFKDDNINVVAAGRLGQEKALDILLKSFKIVVQKNKKFMLNIIGRDAGEKESLMKMTKELALENNVKFWGEQKNPYKFFYFSDLYVLSSIREGLPNTVLENLYLKKPVIATKCVPFMSQLIDDGNNGFLVDVGNIVQLAEAILQYKSIDIETKSPMTSQSDANELFLSICNVIEGS